MARHMTCPDCGRSMAYSMADMKYVCEDPKCDGMEKEKTLDQLYEADGVPSPLMVTRGDGVPVPNQKAALAEFTKGLGPVRLPTRDELLADARKAGWHSIARESLPPRTVIVARQTHDDAPAGAQWLIKRLPINIVEPLGGPFIHGRPATHWHEDTIGHP